MTLFTPILLAHKAIERVSRKLSHWYWQYYAKAYIAYRGGGREKDSRFNGHCYLRIEKAAEVDFGKRFTCNSGVNYAIDNCTSSKITVRKAGHLKIGYHSGMTNTVIHCSDHITIGDYVNIGAGCLIMDSNFHSTDWRVRMTPEDTKNAKTAPIVIGDVVFIGARSIISKGITIGDHAMIAAGSVVVTDIPANCIAGGNPARVIRRGDAKIIAP